MHNEIGRLSLKESQIKLSREVNEINMFSLDVTGFDGDDVGDDVC